MRSRVLAVGALAVALVPSEAPATGLVALGDSFSSGHGAAPYDPATVGLGNTCFRSPSAWPLLLARKLRVPAGSVACNGARAPEVVTSDLRRAEVERRTSQIARIGGDPELVTITIGGNDVGFSTVLRRCIAGDCEESYAKPDGGDVLDDRIAVLERELPSTYEAIKLAAPRAQVVVVGYPRLFPRAVPRRVPGDCAAWDRFRPNEILYLNRLTRRLNAAIARAAAARLVTYVGVGDAFEGEELRCTGRSLVHRLRLTLGWPPYRLDSFHPNNAGHARLAEEIHEEIVP